MATELSVSRRKSNRITEREIKENQVQQSELQVLFTQYLFQNLPHLKGLAKGVTDLGAVVGDTTDSIESASKKVSREVDKSTRDVSRNLKKFFQGRGYSLVI